MEGQFIPFDVANVLAMRDRASDIPEFLRNSGITSLEALSYWSPYEGSAPTRPVTGDRRRPAEISCRPLQSAEAMSEVFMNASDDDFYAVSRMVRSDANGDDAADDDERWEKFLPVRHGDTSLHQQLIDYAGDVKTYTTLASYKAEAKWLSGRRWKYRARKIDVRALYGVALDLDCNRDPSDRKAHLPGALLTQEQVWEGYSALVKEGTVPAPQMWALGTRGCYAIYLFDEPMTRIEHAKALWRTVRECYLLPRTHHLASDEYFRSIIQPLKAPGACGGRVVYHRVLGSDGQVVPRTSLQQMLDEVRSTHHRDDVLENASVQQPYSYDLAYRFVNVLALREENKRTRQKSESHESKNSPKTRNVSPTHNVNWCMTRVEEMIRVTKHYSAEPGYPRRRYFRDLASALKSFYYADAGGDTREMFSRALEYCEAHNRELARPLPEETLRDVVYEAKPGVYGRNNLTGETGTQRSRYAIVRDMGITDAISKTLGLTHLESDRRRVQRLCEEEEAKLQRALEREQKRKEKERVAAAKRESAEEVRATSQAKKARMAAKRTERHLALDARSEQIRELVKKQTETKVIEETVGVTREDIKREKRRMAREGITIPNPRRLKPGRKPKCVTNAGESPS